MHDRMYAIWPAADIPPAQYVILQGVLGDAGIQSYLNSALNQRLKYDWELPDGALPGDLLFMRAFFQDLESRDVPTIRESLGKLIWFAIRDCWIRYRLTFMVGATRIQGYLVVNGKILDALGNRLEDFYLNSGLSTFDLDHLGGCLGFAEHFAEMLNNLLQSDRYGAMAGIDIVNATLHLYIHPNIDAAAGGGGKNSYRVTGSGSHSCLFVPSYQDDYKCCARALVLLLGWKHFYGIPKDERTDEDRKQWDLLRGKKDKPNLRSARALTKAADSFLIEDCGIAAENINSMVSFDDLPVLAEGLSKRLQKVCHINVFSNADNKGFVYSTYHQEDEGAVEDDDIVWFDLLLTDDEHFHAITKVNRLLGNQEHFCYRCRHTYQSSHSCRKNCALCAMPNDHMKIWERKKDKALWKKCEDCNRSFYGEECFVHHKTGDSSCCKRRWKCLQCNRCYIRKTIDGKVSTFVNMRTQDPEDHVCGNKWCNNCREPVDMKTHECFMLPVEAKAEYKKYLFADFECTQDSKNHRVNLAVTMTFDGETWPVHHSIETWVDELMKPKWNGFTVIFHNGKGYDFQFILNCLCTMGNRHVLVQPVLVGGKILYCTLSKSKRYTVKSGIRFVDSLNFLPMALTSFTSTFGLKTKKGFYPHLFNTTGNKYYIGPIPAKKYFGTTWMNAATLQEFETWYNERAKKEWNNYEELVSYCEADVKLLREGCLKFRELVMECTASRHDPFQQITLASSAMAIFRTEMMIPDSIAALHAGLARKLKPALSGGRTGTSKLYLKVSAGERIEYVDFTSAYPFICKTGLYPKGHPTQIWDMTLGHTEDQLPDMKVGVGIYEVDIKCPQNIYHPLLHYKDPESKRLMFDLRDKTKVMYTSLELLKAISLGYEITKYYFVAHWGNTIRGIFRNYINTFLKIKQEAAGFPADCVTDEDKKQYIQEYKEHEGVFLNKDRVVKNKGKYSVAKLYLNSLWGKFGQRLAEEFSSTSILFNNMDDQKRFFKLRRTRKVEHIHYISDYTAVLRCKGKKLEGVTANTNIALAVFTTAQARLLLYNKLLEPLGDRVCYYDTDSCIFAHNDVDEIKEIVPLGKFLGDVTNELGNDKYSYNDEYIIEYASGGPKNYGFLTNKEKKVAKIKGHTLKAVKTVKVLNFERIKNTVLGKSGTVSVETMNFVRNKSFEIKTEPSMKMYQLRYNKRKVMVRDGGDDGPTCIDTRPWKRGDVVADYTGDAKVVNDMAKGKDKQAEKGN